MIRPEPVQIDRKGREALYPMARELVSDRFAALSKLTNEQLASVETTTEYMRLNGVEVACTTFNDTQGATEPDALHCFGVIVSMHSVWRWGLLLTRWTLGCEGFWLDGEERVPMTEEDFW